MSTPRIKKKPAATVVTLADHVDRSIAAITEAYNDLLKQHTTLTESFVALNERVVKLESRFDPTSLTPAAATLPDWEAISDARKQLSETLKKMEGK